MTLNISAANDGINGNFDITVLSGNLTIEAGDDAIHADHILTVGKEDGPGPVINITSCYEGLEGTVVNMFAGDVTIHSTDDAVNAANGDGTYEGELGYAFNMMGGKLAIESESDGIDSNGDINLLGGSATISSASFGGEAGIDYDGQLYISDDFELNNGSGIAGPDEMPGGNGGAPGMAGQGQMGGMPQGQAPDMNGGNGSSSESSRPTPPQMNGNGSENGMPRGQAPDMNGGNGSSSESDRPTPPQMNGNAMGAGNPQGQAPDRMGENAPDSGEDRPTPPENGEIPQGEMPELAQNTGNE